MNQAFLDPQDKLVPQPITNQRPLLMSHGRKESPCQLQPEFLPEKLLNIKKKKQWLLLFKVNRVRAKCDRMGFVSVALFCVAEEGEGCHLHAAE